MGVFRIAVKVRNWQNRYLLPDRQGEDVECEVLADGAAELALPVEMIERLRLEDVDEVRVYTTGASTIIASSASRKSKCKAGVVRFA